MTVDRRSVARAATFLVPATTLPTAFAFLLFRCAAFQHLVARASPDGLATAAMIAAVAALAVGVVVAWTKRAPSAAASPFGPVRWGLVAGAAVVLFMLPAACTWAGARTSYDMFLGTFPWSDAGDAWIDANQILELGSLSDHAHRRPLNSTLLATRLALCDGDLRGALIVQAAMLAASCLFLARAVAADLGRAAGVACFFFLFAYGAEWAPSTMNESLGLTLGALATAALVDGARTTSLRLVLAGLVALTLALSARAGGHFVLPAVAAWAAWSRRREAFGFWKTGVAACGAVVLGLALNAALPAVYGKGPTLGNGNLGQTMYGLATGHPGWTRIYHHYPASRAMPEAEFNEFCWDKTKEQIRRDPRMLARGAERALVAFVEVYGKATLMPLGLGRGGIVRLCVMLGLAIGFLRFVFALRARPPTWLVPAALVGMVASGAIIGTDGVPRVMMSVFPFVAVAFSTAARGLAPRRLLEAPSSSAPPAAGRASIVACAAIFAAALVGPAVAHAAHARNSRAFARTDDAAGAGRVFRIDPNVARVEFVPDDAPDASLHVPRLPRGAPPVPWLAGADVLLRTTNCSDDPSYPALVYLQGPRALLSDRVRHVRAWGTRVVHDYADGKLDVFVVSRFEVVAEQ